MNDKTIASPAEDDKKSRCLKEGLLAGFKAACIAAVATAVPLLVAVRKIPLAKKYINHAGRVLIPSYAFLVTLSAKTELTMTECARRDTVYDRKVYDKKV